MSKNLIGLPVDGSKRVVEHLNKYLANLHVLYTKLHNYHWNVEGQVFFTIHAKLEEIYDGVNEEIDAVAERILMLGERPLASLADYLKVADLKEAPSEGIQGKELIEILLADFQAMINSLREGIETAQEVGDEVTVDMMIGALSNLEKQVWMLDAFLRK
ncbi:MAG TPA: DNA starvation/stationary phase protection protein [Firmicutes bacterium]|nr:DNA starvation/stationary phase protection protein [Bacillota bacterium]